MYLKKIFIKDVGPIEKIDIQMPFNKDENPKPLVIVGENGVGKSILLSYVADAILEFQQNTQPTDEILLKNYNGHSYFKICGGTNLRLGQKESALDE